MTVIFSDGQVGSAMETAGDFSAWTATVGSPTVQNSVVKSGLKAMQADSGGNPGEEVSVYKNFDAQTTVYFREYVRFNIVTEETSSAYTDFMLLETVNDGSALNRGEIFIDGATPKFAMSYRTNSEAVNRVIIDSPLPQNNTWYCIEIYVSTHASNANATMWIDGVQKATVSGFANNNYEIRCAMTGSYTPSTASFSGSVYIDDVVVSDAYIGPESSYSPKTRSSLPNTMMTMLNNKMFFSAVNRFPKLNLRSKI